jgi:hypothetical protein
MNTTAINITHDIRKETSTRRAVEIVAALLAERDALKDLLLEVLPYAEKTNPSYKPEVVRQLTARIRAQMEPKK